MKPSLQDYKLYLVTDSHFNKGYTVLEQVEYALLGGVKMIQIREKHLPQDEYVKLAADALKLTRAKNAFLIVNDSVDVAKIAGADGVHLGQEDLPVSEVRKILGQNVTIGVSVKTPKEAIDAENDGADYLAVNGVFPTATKKDLGYLPGLDGVRLIRHSTSLPVIGIGGITVENYRSVLDAGAHGVAVVTAITMADNIPRTCRIFLS